MNLDALSVFLGGSVAVFAQWLTRKYFGSYLDEKGKNLASKEDIGALTTIVEEVKLDNSRALETMKAQLAMDGELFRANHSLRMAALDARLEAHQEAYSAALTLRQSVFASADVLSRAIAEVQELYARRCLYLDACVGTALLTASSAAGMHAQLVGLFSVREAAEENERYAAEVSKNMRVIEAPLSLIKEAMALPPISSVERALGSVGDRAPI